MNDRFDLRIITQPHSQVYWGYFRRLVFGNSSTKHNKLTYFSNSMLFCSDVLLPFSHIPRCIHAKTPDFPRLFEPREISIENIRIFPADILSSSNRTHRSIGPMSMARRMSVCLQALAGQWRHYSNCSLTGILLAEYTYTLFLIL